MDIPTAALWICVISALIFANAFFALCETSLLESHKSRLEKLADDGNRKALHALHLLENPEPASSVIQIGIKLISILLGTCAGIIITPYLADHILWIPYSHQLSFAASVTAITCLTMVLSESLPRRIALQNPEKTLMGCQKHLRRLIFWTTPLISLLSYLARLLLGILGVNSKVNDTVTEDEVKDLIEQGTEDGTFEKAEQDMVDRIFHMSDQKAYSLMTARTQMMWLDLEDSTKHNLKLIKETNDTIIPVGRGSLDEFCGVVYAKDLLNSAIDKEDIDLNNFIRKPLFVPKTMETFKVLEKFRKTGSQEAMVMDEYGGVIGFITLRDILLELIGDNSIDESDSTHILPRGENQWQIDGLCSIDDFKEKFDIDDLPAEEEDHFQTMGGFATSQFGYIPKVGERFEWNEFSFEISSLAKHRIDKMICHVTKKEPVAVDDDSD